MKIYILFNVLYKYLISVFKLNFVYNLNSYIAFGIPLPKFVMYFVTVLILFVLFYLLYRSYTKKDYIYIFSLRVIIIGAISNLYDRVYYGAVIE